MQNEAIIRLSVFLGLFAVFAALEAFAPKRPRVQPRAGRWFTNLSLTVINTVALRGMALALPLLAVGAALDAGAKGWGSSTRRPASILEKSRMSLMMPSRCWLERWILVR